MNRSTPYRKVKNKKIKKNDRSDSRYFVHDYWPWTILTILRILLDPGVENLNKHFMKNKLTNCWKFVLFYFK